MASNHSDSTCARSSAETTTDADGTFRLPATRERHRVFWVVPGLDRAAPRYRLCAGTPEVLRPAYSGPVYFGRDVAADTVTCIQWTWEERQRVTCTGPHADRSPVVEGGRWSDANGATGRFRLLFSTDSYGVVQGDQLFVQWLETSGSDSTPLVVRATVDLGTAAGLRRLGEPRLRSWDSGEWVVAVLGSEIATGQRPRRLYLRLGPPGQVTKLEVSACTSGAADGRECRAP